MSDRKSYIDIGKGIAIIGIMLMHYENGVFPVTLNRWVGCFMIALFYFVSGYLSSARARRWYVSAVRVSAQRTQSWQR